MAADAPHGANAAARILEEECHRQNAPDGGNREQAFAYQTFVLDFLLIAGLAARGARRGFLAGLLAARRDHDRLPRVDDQRRGQLPMIGDADDGYVVKLAAEPGFSPHISLIVTGAVLFGREDLARKAGALDGKTATLLGVEAVRRLAQLRIRGRARLPAAAAVLRSRATTCWARRSRRRMKFACWWTRARWVI